MNMTLLSRFLIPIFLLSMSLLSACGPAKLDVPTATSPPPTHAEAPSPQLTQSTAQPASPEPSATIAPTSRPGCQPGSIVRGVIDTRLLDKPMTYNVYLPPCYADEPDQRYPVLYLLHGQNYAEDQWLRLGLVETADRLINAGDVAPFIVIMPFDHSFKQPSGYRFEEVFLDLLIPQIDTAYRTLPDAAHRAIGGLSRGGAWALHLGLSRPDVFGTIGAHSPAIFYSDTATLPLKTLEIPEEQFPRIYLDAGDNDSEYETVSGFEEFLNKNNLPHEWHFYLGFHDERYWSSHLEEYLRWYAAGWASP